MMTGSITKTNVSVPSITDLEKKLKHCGVDIRRKKAIGNAIILLDCSGSMAGDKLVQAKAGSKEFIIQAQRKNYLIGLISFSSYARVVSGPTSDYYKICDQLDMLSGYGSTNLSDAIRKSFELFNKTIVDKVLVIVTDGMPNNVEEALYEAKKVKNAGVDIIAIGTDDADIDFLRKITSRNNFAIPVENKYLAKAISSATKLLTNTSLNDNSF